MAREKWTAGQVIDVLRHAYGLATDRHLSTEEWALLTEVQLRSKRVGYGGREHEGWWGNTRSIDVLLVRNWHSGVGHRRIAVEVKVSRADYRNETDAKRQPAEESAHQTYYAAPAGIIDPATLPPGWGLIEVYRDAEACAAGKGWDLGGLGVPAKVRKRPVERTPVCDLDYLAAAGFRRASRAEERIRRGEDDVAKVPGLEAEVNRLLGQLARRDEALARARTEAREWASRALAIEGMQECADCAQPIRYVRREWRHVNPLDDAPCTDKRAEADRLDRERRYGARYTHGYPGPVLPRALRQVEDATQGA